MEYCVYGNLAQQMDFTLSEKVITLKHVGTPWEASIRDGLYMLSCCIW